MAELCWYPLNRVGRPATRSCRKSHTDCRNCLDPRGRDRREFAAPGCRFSTPPTRRATLDGIARPRAKSLQIESSFRSKHLFGRTILSERSATFRDLALGQRSEPNELSARPYWTFAGFAELNGPAQPSPCSSRHGGRRTLLRASSPRGYFGGERARADNPKLSSIRRSALMMAPNCQPPPGGREAVTFACRNHAVDRANAWVGVVVTGWWQ
jgi:hypothetical protein